MSPEKLHSYAANVKGVRNGHNLCILCEHDQRPCDHSMRDCLVYDTAIKRTNKLVAINACTKCSYKNHQTSKCRFDFKSKCRNCGDNHFTFLCVKNSNSISNPVSEKILNNSSSVKILSCNADCDAFVLPTITCKIGSEYSRLYRAFKDGGCQRNFILTDVANDLDLPIVKNNVSVNIEGFNSSINLMTKIVSVPLWYNGKIHNIEAIRKTSIVMEIKLKGLRNVVNAFLEKG